MYLACIITGFDDMGRDHNATHDKGLRIYRQANQSSIKTSAYAGVHASHSSVR